MPKYYRHKVYGYYLYFTTFCLVEAMHVHASDEQLTDREIAGISRFIKENYMEMYAAWAKRSENGFFIGETI